MESSGNGTIQGSVLGPVLFSLFIRPIYDVESITTYADDNYVMKIYTNKNIVLRQVKNSVEVILKWLKDSGLMVNESKTELCVFHRSQRTRINMTIGEHTVKSKRSMTILGIIFNENLTWSEHIEQAIKNSKKILHAIWIIKNYFSPPEVKELLTSLFFSKLYYRSEIWHLPDLSIALKKSLKKCSANALKLCITNYNQFSTYTEIHKKSK
jgi:hypothetical protein